MSEKVPIEAGLVQGIFQYLRTKPHMEVENLINGLRVDLTAHAKEQAQEEKPSTTED